MSKIIVDAALFGNFTIYTYNNQDELVDSNEVAMETTPSYIAAKVTTYNIDYIGIHGEKTYCEGLRDIIKDKLITEYSNNKIEVEII